MSQQQQQQNQYPVMPFSVNASGDKVKPSYDDVSRQARSGCIESQKLLGFMQQQMQQNSL